MFFQCVKVIRARVYESFNSGKIKGVKINRTKIRGAQNLIGLKYTKFVCFDRWLLISACSFLLFLYPVLWR